MGRTQYIGARYVPLFAEPEEWTDARTYEPLTVVLHNGDSFTSKQFVPVGIGIDNAEFWAHTGNYNAQVEQYRREVATFDGRITQNTNDIETLENQLFSVDATPVEIKQDYMQDIKSYYTLVKIPRDYKLTMYHGLNATYINGFLDTLPAGIYVNGPLNSPMICNGQTFEPVESSTRLEYWYIIGFKPDGTIELVKDINRTLTTADLINAGYENAYGVWCPIVQNGVEFIPSATLPHDDSNYKYIIETKQPICIFGYDNDFYYLATVEGREAKSTGADFNDALTFVKKFGIKNAALCDGGHSVQLWSNKPTYNMVFNSNRVSYNGFSAAGLVAMLGFTIGAN